jgi:membrane protein
MQTIKFILRLINEAYYEWSHDRAARLGAALAYYALFSIAPLLVIMTAIAGAVYGESAAEGQIVRAISDEIGPDAAIGVERLITGVYEAGSSLLTTAVSAILLIYGATNFFIQLRDALNTMWHVRPRPHRSLFGGVVDIVRDRLLASVMVIILSILLLATLALSASLTVLNGWLKTLITPNTSFLLEGGNLLTGFGVTTLLMAVTYKILPDVKIAWRVVWVGALATSFLFNVGAFIIGLYLGYGGTLQSALGAAGSLVVGMIWIAYSAQIIFFGAKFALVYAAAVGTPIIPASYAMRVRLATADQQQPGNNGGDQA